MAATPFVVLIPARLSSTRLPHKPLADLAGLPMVVRVAHRAQSSSATQVVVAADHDSIVQACEDHGVPAGPINDLSEVFADPQVIARKLRLDMGGVPGVRSPFTFSGAELSLDRPAPKLGEHQDEVLG